MEERKTVKTEQMIKQQSGQKGDELRRNRKRNQAEAETERQEVTLKPHL